MARPGPTQSVKRTDYQKGFITVRKPPTFSMSRQSYSIKFAVEMTTRSLPDL